MVGHKVEGKAPTPDNFPNFLAFDVSSFDRTNWEATIMAQNFIWAKAMYDMDIHSYSDEMIFKALDWTNTKRNRSLAMLADIHRVETEGLKVIASEQDIASERLRIAMQRKLGYYSRLAREIRNRNQFHLIGSMFEELEKVEPHLLPPTYSLMRYGLMTAYLMSCDKDRFLVGLKGGVHWKRAHIARDRESAEPAMLYMALHYVPMLQVIGKREIEVVPGALIAPYDHEKVKIPEPASSVSDLLEDAYFRQRYLVPPEGAEVRFRNAGDLTRMFIIQRGQNIIARLMTTYGDEQVIINLHDGSYIAPNRVPHWVQLTAETHRDLVTANEISSTHYRSLRKPVQPNESNLEKVWNLDDPQVIYIPRQVRVRLDGDFRPPYDGPVRPVKPHLVTNHFRTANMTERHYEEILELEREWGLQPGEIANNVPHGKTWVKPHFSPATSEVIMKTGPIYIKRRILTDSGLKPYPILSRSFSD